MACRNCSAGLGRLPRRLTAAAPRRPNWNSLDIHSSSPVPVPSSLFSARCASSTTTSTTTSASPATHKTAPGRPPRRALHTTPPRQENFLKKALFGRIAQSLAKGQSSYYVYGATEKLYKLCAAQADYTIDPVARKAGTLQTTADGEEIGTTKGGPWHDDLALLPTFSTWAHVTMLHMYLLVVRFRCFDPAAQQAWQAGLVNHFFYQAEAKMEDVHELSSRMIRQRYLKDLFVQWRGLMLACDEGVVKGDAVLASAVWRNLFKAREDVDVRALAAVVAWMRAGVERLGGMTDEAVEVGGRVAGGAGETAGGSLFPSVTEAFKVVDLPTASMRVAFEKAGIRS